jgi:hypothetical protein
MVTKLPGRFVADVVHGHRSPADAVFHVKARRVALPSKRTLPCLNPNISPALLTNEDAAYHHWRTPDHAMSTGWDVAGILKAVFFCIFEVTFFWQRVRLSSYPSTPPPLLRVTMKLEREC